MRKQLIDALRLAKSTHAECVNCGCDRLVCCKDRSKHVWYRRIALCENCNVALTHKKIKLGRCSTCRATSQLESHSPSHERNENALGKFRTDVCRNCHVQLSFLQRFHTGGPIEQALQGQIDVICLMLQTQNDDFVQIALWSNILYEQLSAGLLSR